MIFHAEAVITPRMGVLDTQGKAVEKTLGQLGYDVSDVRVGRIVTMKLEADNGEAAAERVKEMCCDLLAIVLIDTYSISLREA